LISYGATNLSNETTRTDVGFVPNSDTEADIGAETALIALGLKTVRNTTKHSAKMPNVHRLRTSFMLGSYAFSISG
jgi:hypothetical protein